MSQVRLQKLVLKNFRSFLGEHEVEFPSSGLVLLDGESGHGKSTLLLAIAYALGYCPYSAKDLQCWQTEEPMSVELYFQLGDQAGVLHRGDKLWLKIDGEKISGNAK